MDDPNMTMDEYIKLEEENVRRRAEFPAIVIDDAFTPQDALPCKSQVSTPVNDEIDFRISFDGSDDEDYTIICDKNSFSYKMISVNSLKTDSENDNEKAGIPSFPPPKPMTSYIDDLDFFNDFENEFPAICLNMMKRNKIYCTLMIYSPFNIIRPDDLKSENDNNDNDIDIIQSSADMAPLPPREHRHPFLRYQGLRYTNADIADFKERLERIYSQEMHRVQVVDFQGMSELMRDGLFARMRMEHRDDADVVVFTIQAWGRLFDTRGPLVRELILEFLSTLRVGEVLLDLDAPITIQFQLGGARRRLSWRQFILALGLHTGEEMESPGFARFPGTSPFLHFDQRSGVETLPSGLDVGSVNIPYLIARYLRRFAAWRKSRANISGGQFIARLAGHFGLLTAEILGGLTVISPELLIINMGEMVRLQIFAEDAPAVDQGDQAVPVPVHAPQQPPPPPPTAAQTIPQRLRRLEEEVQGLRRDVRSLRGLVKGSMTDQGRFSTWMMSCMAQLMDASGLTYQAFDGTFRGSSPTAFQRRTRQRTSEASTSAAQQDPQQPDPRSLLSLSFPGSKFSTIVHEYDKEQSRIFTLNARIGKRDDFKCVEAG
ncbi:hypothetical protein Tco_0849196, partial [Tanacetum coccineum]